MAGNFLAGFNNLFRPTQQVTTPPSHTPNQQPNQQPNNGPGSSMQLNGGQQPDPNQQQQNTQQQGSPLDKFTDLWKDDPKAAKPVDPWETPLIPMDPAKLAEAAQSHNFLEGLPQDLIQKVMAGNDPQALLQLINTVGQRGLAMSAQLASATANRAGTGMRERYDATLDSKMRQFQLKNSQPKNPALQHPSAKPMVELLRDRIAGQNPQLRPDEVQQMAEDYFTTWAGQFNAGNLDSGVGGPNAPKDEDWTDFLKG